MASILYVSDSFFVLLAKIVDSLCNEPHFLITEYLADGNAQFLLMNSLCNGQT